MPFKTELDSESATQGRCQHHAGLFQQAVRRHEKVITVIGIVVGSIMAIGAIFGALNCMFAAVAARAREIATLRAIGFRGLPVVVAVMLETMLLALLGGLIGGVLAWLIFNGYSAVHAGRRHGRQAQLRARGLGGTAVGRPAVGARDRLHRRPVPGGARGAAAGDYGVARVMIGTG